MRTNPALWYFVVTLLTYFALAFGSTYIEELTLQVKENLHWVIFSFKKTNHPIYSLRKAGTNQFTKNSRYTLLLMSFASYAGFNAVVLYLLSTKVSDDKWNILWYHIIPIPIALIGSIIIGRIFGVILTLLDRRHRRYVDDFKACKNQEEKIKVDDIYYNSMINFGFGYYVLAFIWFIICNLGAMFLLLQIDFELSEDQLVSWWIFQIENNPQWYWLINCIICALIDILILDLIVVFLGKGNNGFARFIQMKGYYFNFGLHEEFLKLEEEE